MKILIVGDANSIHVVNFIKVTLQDIKNVEIVIFDMKYGSNINKVLYSYYSKNNIKVVENNNKSEVLNEFELEENRENQAILYKEKLIKKIRDLGKFDYCLVHFINTFRISIINNIHKQFNNIVPVFWGSDLLRNNELSERNYIECFDLSSKIIFNTEYMLEKFKQVFDNRYDNKVMVIKFPIVSFEKLDEIRGKIRVNDIKKFLNVPLNKNIIMCGHAGSVEEQHVEIIKELSKNDGEFLQQYFFIFPMTYGATEIYIEEVRGLLKQYKIDGVVLDKFLAIEDILNFVIITDCFINVIKTDAFSAMMQENLYSGSTVIYGDWLNYREMEKEKILSYKINNINELSNKITQVMLIRERDNLKLKANMTKIYNISSPEVIRELWYKEVFNI